MMNKQNQQFNPNYGVKLRATRWKEILKAIVLPKNEGGQLAAEFQGIEELLDPEPYTHHSIAFLERIGADPVPLLEGRKVHFWGRKVADHEFESRPLADGSTTRLFNVDSDDVHTFPGAKIGHARTFVLRDEPFGSWSISEYSMHDEVRNDWVQFL